MMFSTIVARAGALALPMNAPLAFFSRSFFRDQIQAGSNSRNSLAPADRLPPKGEAEGTAGVVSGGGGEIPSFPVGYTRPNR